MSASYQTSQLPSDYVMLQSPHRAASGASIQGAGAMHFSGGRPSMAAYESPALPSVATPAPQPGASASSHADSYSLLGAPATAEQLFRLTAIPASMAAGRSAASRRGAKKPKLRLAREGQVISKTFDTFGRRPQPTNGLSLEQAIRLEFEVVVPNFITSSAVAGVPTFASLTASLGLFSGAAACLAVFDQYMIEQVEGWFEFTAPNGTAPVPDLYTAVDLDDSNTPTSLSQVQDHIGALVATAPAGHYHKWRPHIAVAAFSGAFTSYMNAPSTWIDSASPNVQHYGLKAAMLSAGASFSANVVVRVVVAFRAPSIN